MYPFLTGGNKTEGMLIKFDYQLVDVSISLFITTRKEAIDPPQWYQNQNNPVPKLLLRCIERSRDPLVPGGNTTRYQKLDIGTGWCYHLVLMDPSTLVPGENITRYLCLAFGTGWCLPSGTKSASQVTSKVKYLLLSHNS